MKFHNLLIAGTAALCLASAQPVFAQQQLLEYDAIHSPVIGERGMVVSQSTPASEVGAEILRKGGNAVDAAVATAFALAVTLPRAGNLGGDGFMLVYMADTKKTVAIDYRSMAPMAATLDFYLDDEGKVSDKARRGHTAAAVPGTVAGLWHAHQKFGKLPWAQVVAPAVTLAGEGWNLSYDEARATEWAKNRLSVSEAGKGYFFKPDGSAYRGEELFRQPDLAWTLREIQQGGADAFYRGAVARKIAADMKAHGALMTLEDLARYKAVEREPISTTYRGLTVTTMPPPSGGGVAVLQMLNMLETFDLKAARQGSAESTHLMAEAMKLAYADRTRWLGDPDFAKLPMKGLLSKEYAADRARTIRKDRALAAPDLSPGDPWRYEGPNTTHFSVADSAGNVVSNTYTLGSSYGSGAAVAGAGFLLNDQMRNFSLRAGDDLPNALAGGKRMMSTMAPTIVFRDDRPWLVTGTPGGSTILNTILQVIVNVVDHGLNVAEATHTPRVHQAWKPGDLEVEPGFNPDTIALLEAKGHEVKVDDTQGSSQSIQIEDGRFLGAADPRRPGALAVAP